MRKVKAEISFAQSQYYSSLFKEYDQEKIKLNSKILMIGQSYVGEARQFLLGKLIDSNNYKFER